MCRLSMHHRQKWHALCFSVVCSACLFVLYVLHLGLNIFSVSLLKLVTETSTDYEEVTTNLTFSSCENRTCINVTIQNNDFEEQREVFSVRLQRATNLASKISLMPDSATVQIEDDDGRLCTFLYSVHCYCTEVNVCRDGDFNEK